MVAFPFAVSWKPRRALRKRTEVPWADKDACLRVVGECCLFVE